MQKLILPINQVKLTASLDTPAYRKKFNNWIHCGCDMVSVVGKRNLYGCGEGTVVLVGTDKTVGKVVAVVYKDALNQRTGQVNDIVLRYFHLESSKVSVGQKVNINTLLGVYGNTGNTSMALHLHVEADLDTKHPEYTPTLSTGTFLRGTRQGAYGLYSFMNTVENPMDYFHRKTSSPENQTYTTANDAYIRDNDKSIPIV